jgi:hypothetical protein
LEGTRVCCNSNAITVKCSSVPRLQLQPKIVSETLHVNLDEVRYSIHFFDASVTKRYN